MDSLPQMPCPSCVDGRCNFSCQTDWTVERQQQAQGLRALLEKRLSGLLDGARYTPETVESLVKAVEPIAKIVDQLVEHEIE
jgi:hypothetical protein